MYKVKYWSNNQELRSKDFDTLHEAVQFSIHGIPYQSMYGIDLIKEKDA